MESLTVWSPSMNAPSPQAQAQLEELLGSPNEPTWRTIGLSIVESPTALPSELELELATKLSRILGLGLALFYMGADRARLA